MKRGLVRVVVSLALACAFWAHIGLVRLSDMPSGLTCATVEYVFDGDTIRVMAEESLRVRLLGIDAPEIAHEKYDSDPADFYGDEAHQALTRLLPEGCEVFLEYDEEKKDRYGRELCYVWREGALVNERLLASGCARTLFYRPNTRRQDAFLAAERGAKQKRLGLWEQ